MKKKSLDMALKSLKTESSAISDILRYFDKEAFGKAVDALCASDKIITCASGSSGIAAKKFAHTLCCIERNGCFLSPAEAVHGGLGCVKKSDAVVMVSRGGKTSELLPIVSVVNKKGAKLIAVTENFYSPIAKAADVIVPIKVEKESDKYNVMATSSFVATVALFDAMAAAIMEETEYRLEQFALIHPGGAVGELLNKRRG
jgi:D-arabinose 5-phosphate isomerase GutQ